MASYNRKNPSFIVPYNITNRWSYNASKRPNKGPKGLEKIKLELLELKNERQI